VILPRICSENLWGEESHLLGDKWLGRELGFTPPPHSHLITTLAGDDFVSRLVFIQPTLTATSTTAYSCPA
jgi:hypothetical protein